MKHFQTGVKFILIACLATFLVVAGLFSRAVYKGEGGQDFAVFYDAGQILRNHGNPYLRHTPTREVPAHLWRHFGLYAYPPQFSSIAIGLAQMTYYGARSLFDVLNLAAIVAFAWGAIQLLWPGRRLATVSPEVQSATGIANWRRYWWIVAAILLAMPFTSLTLWLRQVTICIFALLIWAWWFDRRGSWLRSGVLLGIATCKPPLVLLPIVWLLFDGRFKTLGVGLTVALAMSIPAFYVLGPLDAFQSWFDSLSRYKLAFTNVPGTGDTFGVRGLLMDAGVPTVDLTVLGIAIAVAIWFFRSYLTDAETLALLVLGGLLTLHAHNPALAGLIVTVPVLCLHAYQRRWVAPVGICLGTLILLPRRVLRALVQPDLLPDILKSTYLQWRVPVVLALGLMIIALVVLRERDERRRPATQNTSLPAS